MTLQTIDYTIFKKNFSNRDLCEKNIKKIVNSIKFKNLLHLRPILVDKQMQVIDGQHRLEAAKLLNIPIYYQIDPESHCEDIILLNNNQKKWDLTDYLNYYVNNNIDPYIRLNDFIKKEKINLLLCLTLLGASGGDSFANFRAGRFKMIDEEYKISNAYIEIKYIQDFLHKKLVGYRAYINNKSFIRALAALLSLESFDFKIFMKKLEMRLDHFHRCSTITSYLEMLKNIYNYKNFDKLE